MLRRRAGVRSPPSPPPPAIPDFQLTCCDAHSWAGGSWRSFGSTWCTDAAFHANCVTNSSCGAWGGDCSGYYCTSFSGSSAPCGSFAQNVCNACRQCFNVGCSYYDASKAIEVSGMRAGMASGRNGAALWVDCTLRRASAARAGSRDAPHCLCCAWTVSYMYAFGVCVPVHEP